MKVAETEALEVELARVQVAAERLHRLFGPPRNRAFDFPIVHGGPNKNVPVQAGEALELTMGTLRTADRLLHAHGVALGKSDPIQVRIHTEIAEVEAQGARIWLRVDAQRGAEDGR